MSPTVRDIARRANVSASTVSRVLNNEPYVGESTRLAVRQAARELDYPLEHLRKAPQVKPRHSVILLGRNNVDDYRTASTSNIDSIIVAGAKEVFNRDYIAAHAYHVTSSFHEAQTLLNKVDKEGVLLLGGIVEHDFAAELQVRNIPFVVAGAHLLPLHVNCVMADIINGMLQAVKHLVSRGVTRIGLANGPNTTNSSEEKYKGFRLALALHNLSFTHDQLFEASDFSSRDGYIATLSLLEQAPDLQGIIYAHDMMAIGGMKALREQGRRIPEDIAAIGFHNFEVASFTDPQLTSIGFDMYQMGCIAAQRLLTLMENRHDQIATTTLISTELHVRSST